MTILDLGDVLAHTDWTTPAPTAGPGDPPTVPWGTNGPCAWPASTEPATAQLAPPDTSCFPVATDPALIGRDDAVAITPGTLGLDDDLVAHALYALGLFQVTTDRDARRLLAMWARRDELTDEQTAEVLAYYPPTLKAVA